MAKYELRKIDPQSRCGNKYEDSAIFNNFDDLRHEINTRQDLWRGEGFNVLNADGEIIFNRDTVNNCQEWHGKKYTLAQLIEDYAA
ncbi:hypothetical protein FNX24_21690 [Salmonella enterica]|nr:hypothetical protein [Salmonella enterica]